MQSPEVQFGTLRLLAAEHRLPPLSRRDRKHRGFHTLSRIADLSVTAMTDGHTPNRIEALQTLFTQAIPAAALFGLIIAARPSDAIRERARMLVAEHCGALPYVEEQIHEQNWLSCRWVARAYSNREQLPLGFEDLLRYQHPRAVITLDASKPVNDRIRSFADLVYTGAIVSTCVATLLARAHDAEMQALAERLLSA